MLGQGFYNMEVLVKCITKCHTEVGKQIESIDSLLKK
jgi:hypothetical protein